MIRITGMNSGLDTERIIHELVRGQRTKVDTVKQNQVSTRWRMDAWQDLNNRVLKLFNGTLGKMRFSDAYAQKTSRVSNNKASVVTGGTAVNGVQSLQINRLATTDFLTGAKLGSSVTNNTRMSQLMGSNFDPGEDMSFTVRAGGKDSVINMTGDTTIQNVVHQLRDAGLNANFDANNGRFFISSRTMCAAGNFTITANNDNGRNALNAMGISEPSPADRARFLEIADVLNDKGGIANQTKWGELVQEQIDRLKAADQALLNTAREAAENLAEEMNDKIINYKQWLIDNDFVTDTHFDSFTDDALLAAEVLAQLQNAKDELKDLDDADSEALLNDVNDMLNARAADDSALNRFNADITRLDARVNGNENSVYGDAARTRVREDIAFAKMMTSEEGLNRSSGQDARITLNGATFTSSTNVFNINGLTITANQLTEPGETITITTEDDTQGIYNMIKDFIKEYNALINEMDRLFNAPSARDYRPLTDEQKDAMSEREIEEWEKRIKDSLLRRDNSLFNISSAMTSSMMTGVSVGGRTMHLSHFGINGLDFFLAAANEKNAFFIDGDEDSAHTSGKANRLQELIANDPRMVTEFFTGLTRNLYSAMDRILLDRNSDFKSVNTIYNDKLLKREYDNFNSEITRQEERLKAMEDKFFKQFSRMEVALAKMQSNQSAVTGLLGMTMMNRR